MPSSTPARQTTSCAIQTDANPVPTRPPTPVGLREAVQQSSLLLATADGPATYGLTTPEVPSPPPAPVTSSCPARAPVPAPHPYPLYDGETIIDGREVDWRVAYIIALGQHRATPHRAASLRDAAEMALHTELLHPGVLDYLSAVFFPVGYDDLAQAWEYYITIMDFCRGWEALVGPF
ncbi:hypothetical protein FRC08_007393 [Ceratobasidium sp. 394]|nr:hypothetical protein FRC08_007393 [Ceratobasidium sp. 394]